MSADSGREGLTGEGALIDACAVLTEIEEVGGPDEKIERLGVLKSVVCCGEEVGRARSSSSPGTERDNSRDVVRGGNGVAEADDLAVYGGEVRDGKVHDEDCAAKSRLEEGVLRSARRSCKACEDTSGSSDSS